MTSNNNYGERERERERERNNQNPNQLAEWEVKRDYRWKWMWRSLGAAVVNFVVFVTVISVVGGDYWNRASFWLNLLMFFGLVIVTAILVILSVVCLVGWLLARYECKKLGSEKIRD